MLDYDSCIYEWFENSKSDSAVQNWKDIFEKAFYGLLRENIPLNKNYYHRGNIPAPLYEKSKNTNDIPSFALSFEPGIILEKVYYYSQADGKNKTKWLTKLDDVVSKPIYSCRWIFRPLCIKNSSQSRTLKFSYKMEVCKKNYKNGELVRYAKYIETGLDGEVLEHEFFYGDKNDKFPHRFPFPTEVISKINRYLANNFFQELWDGPSCAAWYCVHKGVAYYLDNSWLSQESLDKIEKTLWEECDKLLNDPNCEAASVLLSYTCFSVLKPFFSSYHELRKDFKYMEAKQGIPKQIAINIQSDNMIDAERLVNICCGYFLKSNFSESTIVDGIKIQQAPHKMAKLSVEQFEKALLQPACVLWVNYRPDTELIQSGKLLNIRIHSQNEGGRAIAPISTKLVRVLTNGIHKETIELSNGSQWGHCLERSDQRHKKRKVMPYTLDCKLKKEISFLSHFSKSLRSKYITAAVDVCATSDSKETKDEIMPDLDISIVEKIAYLSASFRVFGEIIFKSEDKCTDLCDKVKNSIIHAFTKQIGLCNPTEILAKYISSLLESGQCARIRGQNSDSDGIRAWYDPKSNRFLFPSKIYFDDLKRTFLTVDVNKREFEEELVRANALCIVQREKQDRRTFEVVVQKGGGKLSVLKINAASLLGRFSENARKQLAKMERDKTSYRS